MDESANITQKILLSILMGNQNVGEIRLDTGLSPKTLSKYLKLLPKQGLINVARNRKRGQSKPCLITDSGIKWLVNIPLNDNLQVLLKIADQMKNPANRESFKNTQAKKDSQNTKIVQNYFIERFLKGDKSPLEYPDGMDLTDSDQLFREALKKILALHIYLISNPYQTPEEIENSLKKDFVLFSPNMSFAFSWHRGALPELEYELQKADNFLRCESEKLQAPSKDEGRSKVTHLLGLDFVSEGYFEEYSKATSDSDREKILAKIEEQAGWSVGKYIGELFVGKEAEIAKYVDVTQRPFLMKFISSFDKSKME